MDIRFDGRDAEERGDGAALDVLNFAVAHHGHRCDEDVAGRPECT